jgi:predicted TPR repeat methyltransferase
MWDVIEHLPNPDAIIAGAAHLIRPGGHIALTTGDIGSLNARIRGDAWRMIHPPTHLFYFDRISIGRLLAKHGFEVVSFGHCTTYRNIKSVAEQLIRIRQNAGASTRLLCAAHNLAAALKLDRANFGVNLYDIMEVIAARR